ncbi:hypothetical protein SAMN05444004_10151 [Jannaschia faecimaris]|uniref:Uncharacterized protein n=1 Tax=Jannaschia faecimaris TaxID=1244108 RepID=A0A1H3IP57_9RHOB|nr:hypothetical protein SAMN05444004_10151 [Jannaschia faecimaris]
MAASDVGLTGRAAGTYPFRGYEHPHEPRADAL